MTLEERIARLEAENLRRKKTSRLLALCLAAALGMTGAALKAQPLEADKILIKDSSGRVRIFLGLRMNEPTLEFRTPGQKNDVTLRAGKAGPHLLLSNANEGKYIALSATNRLWGLSIRDAKGNTRAKLSASESGGHIIQRNTIIR